MHHTSPLPRRRPAALRGAVLHGAASLRRRAGAAGAGAVLLLLLAGCAAGSPSEASRAAEAKPLTQAQFITLQRGLSNGDFADYVSAQSLRLGAGTDEFVAAYTDGDDTLARALYAPTRVFYNRMLVAADSFTDLDAALDGGDTGWRAAERDLFGTPADAAPALPEGGRATVAEQIRSRTAELLTRVAALRPTIDEQAAGVAALMSGRATEAAAGTREPFSHTDLYDLQAYVDSARLVFTGIRPILVTENAALATTLDHRFQAVEGELNGLRTGVSFPGFDTLGDAEKQTLAGDVADLSESLGEVPATMKQS